MLRGQTGRVKNVGTTTNKQANRELNRQPTWTSTGGRSGFTLIEIVVVVTLLTVLALIAIPNFISARKDAAKNSCINNIKEISYATEQWALEKKKGLNAQVTFDDISPYLKGSITCPAGGKTFDDSYQVSIVANEPTCLREPQDHYWLGSTAVAAIQTSQSNSSGTTSSGSSGGTANGLVGGGNSSNDSGAGNTSGKGNENGNGKGNNGKGNGKGNLKGK
jgi:prepilin-type N-terminal cleavage/methylation domain-containing protein